MRKEKNDKREKWEKNDEKRQNGENKMKKRIKKKILLFLLTWQRFTTSIMISSKNVRFISNRKYRANGQIG